MKPCEHCPNPHKEFYKTQCMYAQRLKRQGCTQAQIEEWLEQGFEPPCARDAYLQRLDKQSKTDQLVATVSLLGAVALIIVLALLFA